MKKNCLLIPCLAVLALTGCNRDDFSNGNQNAGSDEVGYIAVNIAQSQSAGSRADSVFENGTNEENAASSALFYIFSNKENNPIFGSPTRVNLDKSESVSGSTDGEPNVEKKYDAVLVITNSETNPIAEANKLVCILNAPENFEATHTISTLADLEAVVDNYSVREETTGDTTGENSGETTGVTTKKVFMMTNSVYKNGETKVICTDITSENVKTTKAEALAKPVTIYVERTVAKITANKGMSTVDNKGAKLITKDGKEKNYDIKLTGIEVANIAQKSYLFKNIEGISYTWAWNDVNNRRSYWETFPTSLTYINKSYNNIATDQNFNINTDNLLTEYVQPNTSDQKTAILVTAKLIEQAEGEQAGGEQAGGEQAKDIVYFRGYYYTDTEAKKEIVKIATENGYKINLNNNESNLTEADFVWTHNENYQDDENSNTTHTKMAHLARYEVVAQVKYSLLNNIIKTTNTTSESPAAEGLNVTQSAGEELNKLLKGDATSAPYRARVYKEGRCYYFVNIIHKVDDGNNIEGIVRNHVYKLTINSIEGPGVPVNYPDEEIIPETPKEDQYHLAAEIQVLDWKIVNQTIDF